MTRDPSSWRGSTVENWEGLFRDVSAWAESEPEVRTALLVGSRARTNVPADPLSDADIVLFARSTERLLRSQDWLRRFGDPVLSLLEPTALGGSTERRVLYSDGRDVDFAIFEASALTALLSSPEGLGVLRRGFRVLVDKDGAVPPLGDPARDSPSGRWSGPTEGEFAQVLADFGYHAVWAAKKLRRGELWTAKSACDGYLKRLLLTILEWRTRAESGGAVDTWHNGRFLERWADPQVLDALRSTYAHYDRDDLAAALRSTMRLFWDQARRAGRALGYSVPDEQQRATTEMVEDLLAA